MKAKPANEIATIRNRRSETPPACRERMEQSAFTGYKADRDNVIRVLNDLLAASDELRAV